MPSNNRTNLAVVNPNQIIHRGRIVCDRTTLMLLEVLRYALEAENISGNLQDRWNDEVLEADGTNVRVFVGVAIQLRWFRNGELCNRLLRCRAVLPPLEELQEKSSEL